MIWLRRTLAVLLLPIFLALFLVALVLIRVNDTVLSADFYVDELRKADIFNFLYDQAAPAAFKEVNQEISKKAPDSRIKLESVEAKLVAAAKDVLPPRWLEEQSELVIRQVVPYITGDRDSFAVTIPVADRVETLGTVLKREMGNEDTYNLIFEDVIAPALEDAWEKNELGQLPLGITLSGQDVVEAVREVLPSPWVKARVEHSVDQVVPYLTGKAEHFAIALPVSDRIEAAAPVLKKLLVRSKTYEVLHSQEFAEAVDRELREFGQLPFGTKLTAQQLVKALQETAPPEWLQARFESGIDAAAPYLSGRQQGFEVVVPLKDRIQVASPVVKGLLRDAGAYNLLFDQVVVRIVKEKVGPQVALPLGVTITSDDIVPLLRQVLPPQWVQEQAEKMLDQGVPYLTGESAGFRVVVPLKERKQAAATAIQELADKKLREVAARLPQCTVKEALDQVQKGFTGALPACLPSGYSLEQIKQALGINIPGLTLAQIEQQLGISLSIVTKGVTAETIKESFGIDLVGQVSQFVVTAIPDEWVYSDVDLRNTLGPKDEERLDRVLGWTRQGFRFTDADLRDGLNQKQEESLDQALKWTREGFTFTDADLRQRLGPNQEGDLDQVLKWVREGVTFTEADLRDAISGGQGGAEALEQIDQARKWMGLQRNLRFLYYLVPALVLAAIGFLGGRSWRSRLAWAAEPLLIAAGLAFAAFGPVYQGVARPAVNELLDQLLTDAAPRPTGVALLVAEKGISMAKTAVSDFFSGLAIQSLVLLIMAAGALVLAVVWPRVFRRQRTATAPGA